MNVVLKIEKNIPISAKSWNLTSGFTSTLRGMEVGDSIFLAGFNRNQGGRRIAYAKRKTGMIFTLRTVEGGVRIWRVS